MNNCRFDLSVLFVHFVGLVRVCLFGKNKTLENFTIFLFNQNQTFSELRIHAFLFTKFRLAVGLCPTFASDLGWART